MLKVQSSQFILPKAKDIQGDDACDFAILDNTFSLPYFVTGLAQLEKVEQLQDKVSSFL